MKEGKRHLGKTGYWTNGVIQAERTANTDALGRCVSSVLAAVNEVRVVSDKSEKYLGPDLRDSCLCSERNGDLWRAVRHIINLTVVVTGSPGLLHREEAVGIWARIGKTGYCNGPGIKR